MPDRSWERGLPPDDRDQKAAQTSMRARTWRMTYQRFFRRYLLLGGAAGTAPKCAPDHRVYSLNV
jgi:preprotein translocase subunit SecA